MQISLEEAFEIHARALTHRLGEKAPFDARQRAVDLKQLAIMKDTSYGFQSPKPPSSF